MCLLVNYFYCFFFLNVFHLEKSGEEVPDLQNVGMNATYTVHQSPPFESNTLAKV
jgi:hypothetical protein